MQTRAGKTGNDRTIKRSIIYKPILIKSFVHHLETILSLAKPNSTLFLLNSDIHLSKNTCASFTYQNKKNKVNKVLSKHLDFTHYSFLTIFTFRTCSIIFTIIFVASSTLNFLSYSLHTLKLLGPTHSIHYEFTAM